MKKKDITKLIAMFVIASSVLADITVSAKIDNNINYEATNRTIKDANSISIMLSDTTSNEDLFIGRNFLDLSLELVAKKEEEERLKREEEERKLKEEAERREAELEAIRLEEERIAALLPNFDPYDLTEASNLNFDKAYALLEGSALQSAAGAYVYAEEVYGVNAIFLMALTSLESGHGRSTLAMENNNLGGVKSIYGGWEYFSDWEECIMHIAELLSGSYLTEDGVYFNGYSIWGVNIKYCQDGSDWAGNIITIANDLMNKL